MNEPNLPETMTHEDQIHAFTNDVISVINRYIGEFDLPTASITGALCMVTHEFVHNNLYSEGDDGDDEGERWKKNHV